MIADPCALTDRQAAVLEFIRDYQRENGLPPTYRDIGLRFRIGNTNGVHCHIIALRKKGFLKRQRYSHDRLILADNENERLRKRVAELEARVAELEAQR